jgi:hypothetical protein
MNAGADLFGDPAGSIHKDAYLSACGLYRYWLSRRWNDGPLLPFVMFNPSTADASVDDPTIRRCMGFARREDYAGIWVINLHAFRATSPVDLRRALDPFGPENADICIKTFDDARDAGVPIICAWGALVADFGVEKPFLESSARRRARLLCLGKTKSGKPRHPLYVPAAQSFEAFP